MDRRPGERAGSSRPARSDRAPDRLEDGALRTRLGRRVADEANASEARGRLRELGMVPIEPDPRIGVLLGPDEGIIAVRRGVSVERRHPCPGEGRGVGGDLYVTTRRLVHLGRQQIVYDLDAIQEAVVAGDQLLLLLDEGVGMAIVVEDPSLLRVEISAARAAARRARPAGARPADRG